MNKERLEINSIKDGASWIAIDQSSLKPNTISLDSKYLTGEGLKYYTRALLEMLSKKPMVEHKCHNCGGAVEMDIDKHIFICPYCHSAYAIGTTMINDRG